MSVTSRFPAHWRCTVTVHRPGGRDPKGNPLPGTTHEVPDCLVEMQGSDEEPRSDAPDTTAWLRGPAGADFASTDQVVVPESDPPRLWPSGRFQVTGRPSFGPLGVSVPLKEV